MEKKKKVKLLALQMGSEIAQIEKNIEKVKTLLQESLKKYNPDFIFLPEVWTCGWDCESFPKCAEEIKTAKSVNMLQEIAKTYSVNVIGGSFIQKKSESELVNATPVINRLGKVVCTYEKNHLFSYYGCNEGDYITKGTNPILVELDGIKIGLSICYDIRFPELYRAYRKNGADIMVNLAAWGAEKKVPWDNMNTSRAVENQTYFVALTQTGVLKDGSRNLGHSMILDYKGDVLDEINIKEGVIFAEIDLDEMYQFREKCKVLDDIKNNYEVLIK